MDFLKRLRWSLLLSGILVIGIGIFLLSSPLTALTGMATYIGLAILFSGISEISSYFSTVSFRRSGWVLTSGILSTLFGLWTIFGSGTDALMAVITFIFAVWVLSSGMMRVVGAFSLKAEGSRSWVWVLIVGLLSALAGFVLLFNPLLSAVSISSLIALMFIFHGVNNLLLFWGLRF